MLRRRRKSWQRRWLYWRPHDLFRSERRLPPSQPPPSHPCRPTLLGLPRSTHHVSPQWQLQLWLQHLLPTVVRRVMHPSRLPLRRHLALRRPLCLRRWTQSKRPSCAWLNFWPRWACRRRRRMYGIRRGAKSIAGSTKRTDCQAVVALIRLDELMPPLALFLIKMKSQG